MAEDPSDGLVFCANANGASVVVIASTTAALVGQAVSVSPGPEGIAYVPVTKQIEVFSVESPAMNVLADSPNISSLALRGAEVGTAAAFTVAVANGTPPYQFQWSGLPPNCPPSNAPEVECPVQLSTGTYHTMAKVTDSAGYNWSNSVAWSVAPGLRVGNASASPDPVDLNFPTTIASIADGGVDPRSASFSYVGLPGGCLSHNTSSLECTPRSLGLYPITIRVTDAAGGAVTTTVGLDVVASPVVIAAFASPASLGVNGTTEFVAVVMGGIAPYSYSWTGSPPGCEGGNASSFPCSPSTSGTYLVQVEVTDALGIRAEGSFSVNVTSSGGGPPPSLTVLAFVAEPAELTLGGNVSFITVVSGGIPPYSFAYVGLPTGCPSLSLANLTCRPTAVGSYHVGVVASDPVAQRSLANVTVTISAGERGTSQAAGLSAWWLGLLAGAAGFGGGALMASAVLLRRYSGPRSSGSSRQPIRPRS